MRNAMFTEFLGDGPQDFRLAYGQFLELQEKTGVGPMALYRRIEGDDWMISDISEIIRVGLIGAGMAPKEAFRLVKRYVIDRAPMENIMLARAILLVGLTGAPEEEEAGSKSKPKDDGDGLLKSRDAYAFGAVAGFTPQEIDGMSLHQFKAAYDGYSSYHQASNGAMTEKEKDDLFTLVQEEQDKIDGIA